MFLVVPYNTDAPLYHWPFATLGLIVANLVVFGFQFACPEINESLILEFGKISPVQWITSMFMHAGFVHLIGNMMFLWAFGIVVEGKIGWWRFVAIYLAIGVAKSLLVQLLMLGYDGESGALGASGAIFGIMAIALTWAPQNSLVCKVVLVWVVPVAMDEIEIQVLFATLIYVAMNLLIALLNGFHMSTEVLHLIGFCIGGMMGLWMLLDRRVDCEGYDIVAMLKNTSGETPVLTREQEREREERDEADAVWLKDESSKIREYIDHGHFEFAHHKLQKLRKELIAFELTLAQMKVLVKGLMGLKKYEEAIWVMRDYCQRNESMKNALTIKIAQVYLHYLGKSVYAVDIVSALPTDQLSTSQKNQIRQLKQAARISLGNDE